MLLRYNSEAVSQEGLMQVTAALDAGIGGEEGEGKAGEQGQARVASASTAR